MNSEIWAPIVGFESTYEVSTHGRVRNIAARRGTEPGRLLKPRVTKDGYHKVILRDGSSTKAMFIHRAMFIAHVRPLRPDEQIDHLDGNQANNHLCNLEAVSQLENTRRSFARGRKSARGEAQGKAKFTDDVVLSIRRRVSCGELQKNIAKELSVTPSAINCVVKRKTWAHLP